MCSKDDVFLSSVCPLCGTVYWCSLGEQEYHERVVQARINKARAKEEPQMTHILHSGLPLCGFSTDVPDNWPDGNKYVPIGSSNLSNCEECKDIKSKLPEL